MRNRVVASVISQDDETMMLENPRSWRLHARRTFSRMAPRKPDTMELFPVSTRPEIGRGDPTAPVYHRLCYLSSAFCPLWLVYARIIHRNNSSNAVPPLLPRVRSGVIHYFHGLHRFWPSVWLQVPFVLDGRFWCISPGLLFELLVNHTPARVFWGRGGTCSCAQTVALGVDRYTVRFAVPCKYSQ